MSALIRCSLSIRPLFTLLIAVSALVSFQAHARLGETPAQIESRYGKPLDSRILRTNEYWMSYTNANYSIMVHFWNGKSAQEHLTAYNFTDDETAKALFTRISGKEPTKIDQITKPGGYAIFYTAGDVQGQFTCFPNEKSYLISVVTTEYRKHLDESFEDEKRKAVEKF